jgi:hypothetical protein
MSTVAQSLSAEELVERVRRSGVCTTPEQMTHLLDELRADGLAEDVNGRWRLTREARRQYGKALHDLGFWR